jgi:hypothetical protein
MSEGMYQTFLGFCITYSVCTDVNMSFLVVSHSPGRHSIVHISQDGKEKMLRLELNEIAAPRIFAVHRTKRKILLVHGVRKMSIFKEL